MKEHHIGIVVKNLEESQVIFEQLGYKVCSDVSMDKYQHNKVLFLENKETSHKIELIEALNDHSTVKKATPGIHHICYEVEEQENFREIFKKMSIGKIFTQDMVAPAMNNRTVMFACLKNGVFVEFVLR